MNVEKSKLSRAQILTYVMFVVVIIFIARLFYIQIVKHEYYSAKADQMQTTKQTINPQRGQIFVRDADGNLAPLVLNRTVYTLFADPSAVENTEKVKELTNRIAGGQVINGSLDKLANNKLQYVVLAKKISYDQAQEIRKADLKGIGLQIDSERVYPEGALAAQVLGFMNSDGKGQYGVEQYLNDKLSGEPGLLQAVTDVRRIPLTIGTHDVSVPAQNGEDIVLSVDRNIQSQAEELLAEGLKNAKATSGSIIVMDPQNGRVLAMASLPSFDPSNFGEVEDASVFQAKAATNSYEPGSVMKLFTVGASMDTGNISRDSTFPNSGCLQIDDAKICNVERSVDGINATTTDILRYSLNTGAVWALEQMGNGQINLKARQTLYNYLAKNYHLNAPTGIEISGESDSVLYLPDMPNGVRVTYSNMAFGQGMQLTMVQVISAFSAAINGGKYYQPTVILGSTDENGKSFKENEPKLLMKNVLKPEISNNLKQMLQQARYSGAGGRAKDNGFFVGGKSGTAQKIDPKTGKYSDDLTTGTYIGFGADSSETPKYAIMVRVDDAHNGGYSGSAAAQPIFDAVSNFMIQYEGVSK